MALHKSIDTKWELQEEFRRYDRDNYSLDGYEWILDYYDGEELDVIAICCDCTEYDVDGFVDDYNHYMTFGDYVLDNDILYDYCEEHGIDESEVNIDIFRDEHFDDYVEELIGLASDRCYIDRIDDNTIMVAE